MNAQQLAKATGCARIALAAAWLPFVVEAMAAYEIDANVNRQAHFLAQVGHESGGLAWTRELWGPTPAQKRYEGRADLGNTQPGDGSRFRGHGLIQTTGRGNHARVRDRLRAKFPHLDVPDFEADPEALRLMQWAALSAADFWDDKGLNALADADKFVTITRRINGGENGIEHRRALLAAARQALA